MKINNIGFLLDDDTIQLWKVIDINNISDSNYLHALNARNQSIIPKILTLELLNDPEIVIRAYDDNFWAILDYLP